jgi:hypothetical protein
MHAYLIIGGNKEKQNEEINKIKDKIDEEIVLETDKSHTIEDIRKLQKQLSIAPQNPDLGRLVILLNANLLTNDAANAFLKTLEEPVGKTIFILTATNEEQVIETIRSRTQIIYLPPEESDIDIEKASEEFSKICSSSTGERFIFIDSIGDRQEALIFCLEQLHAIRRTLNTNFNSHLVDLLGDIQSASTDLENNVNVKLVLTDLILKYPQSM